jgi:hypothetical protein
MVGIALILAALSPVALAAQKVVGQRMPFEPAGSQAAPGPLVSQIGEISQCPWQNAEVEQAVDAARGYVYEEWIGCRDMIGFARSSDGGRHFDKPIALPQSLGAWDPALAIAPDGTLYAAFMQISDQRTFPVVEASYDHGLTFPQVRSLIGPVAHNFGDREFIAVGPDGSVYLTWDYGPSNKLVDELCPSNGSCTFIAGDLNEVIQVSTDGGRTWGPITYVSPGFPASGADSAELVVEQNGRIDIEYQAYQVLNTRNYKLGLAYSYFTSSVDRGRTWSAPVRIGPPGLSMSPKEWWIDGDISIDAAGNLYATWDTQVAGQDVGWLSYSTNHGVTWSPLQRVTPDHDNAVHIVQVVGGQPGIAYIGWLSNSSPRGYALYLRPFSITRGWLSQPLQVSPAFGSNAIWPGDTFGISTLPPEPGAGSPGVLLSWGSAIDGEPDSEIFAAVVTY